MLEIGVPKFVNERAVAFPKCLPLQRQRDHIAQAALEQDVLGWQHQVVGFQVFLVDGFRAFGQQSGNRRRQEFSCCKRRFRFQAVGFGKLGQSFVFIPFDPL